MTSPILVMNFYSLLNFKYVNLIPRWPPKICIVKPSILMYAPGLTPSLLLPALGSPFQTQSSQGEDGLAQACPSSVYKNLAFLSRCPSTEWKCSQPFNNLRGWLGTVGGMLSKTTSLLVSGFEIPSIRNTLSYNIVSTSQLGSKLFMNQLKCLLSQEYMQ